MGDLKTGLFLKQANAVVNHFIHESYQLADSHCERIKEPLSADNVL